MAENKSFLDSIAEIKKPESFDQETFVAVNNTQKIKGIVTVFIVLVISVIAIYLFYTQSQKVQVIALVGENITDASLWAQSNDVNIAAKNIYDFNNEEGIVLEQSLPEGETIKKNDTLTLQVSAGPDPQEAFVFPDIMSMNADEIDVWIAQNKLTGVKISTKSSNIVAEDQVVEYSFTDGDEENFQRKNRVAIVLSSGPAAEGETVVVVDFSGMNAGKILQWGLENNITINLEEANNKYFPEGEVISQSIKSGDEILKSESITVLLSLGVTETVPDYSAMNVGKILQWGSDNGIKIHVLEEFSKYFLEGTVISQSVKSGSELSSTEQITIHISLGEPVVVPDFSTQTKEEASAWAKLEAVNLITIENYSSTIPKGKLISQGLSKGFNMRTGEEIKLIYSLGKVEVTSYIGKTMLDMLAWQSEVNSKGANISLTFNESYGSKNTAGKIIEQSIENNQVGIGTAIEVTISKGAIVRVPDFTDLSETECVTLANSLGINVFYEYASSTTVDEGYFISQTPSKGELIADSGKVTVTISISEVTLTTVKVPDFSSMKSSEILKWGTDNDVQTQLFETYSSFIASGSIVSQSIKEDTIVNKGSAISIGVSIGKVPQTNETNSSSMVPDFSGFSDSEASAWAKSAGVNLAVVSKYSDAYTKGVYYAQSIAKEVWIEEGREIAVTQSLGKVSISSFVGKTKLDVLSWQQDVNSKGASITINFTNSDGLGASSGKVKSQTIMNDYISLDATISIDLE